MPFKFKIFGNELHEFRALKYGDVVDRLHYYYSVLIFFVLASALLAGQFFGNSISCWTPVEFNNPRIAYTENYCFWSNTYYTTAAIQHGTAAQAKRLLSGRMINYYQWVPFVLSLQAALFYVPHMIWKFLSEKSGISADAIVEMAIKTLDVEAEKYAAASNKIARFILATLRCRWDLPASTTCCKRFWSIVSIDRQRASGNLLCWFYIFMKLLNCINVVAQFFIIDMFLGTKQWFGFGRILIDFLQGGNSSSTAPNFPRVTYCDMTVQDDVSGRGPNSYTIQCFLPLNVWNEKVYMLVWCWMIIVTVCSIWNLFSSICLCFQTKSKQRLIESYLTLALATSPPPTPATPTQPMPSTAAADTTDRKISTAISASYCYQSENVNDGHLFRKFVRDQLRSDGILLLRFMRSYAGDVVTADIVSKMFQQYAQMATHSMSDRGMRMTDGMLEFTRLNGESSSTPIKRNIDKGIGNKANGIDAPQLRNYQPIAPNKRYRLNGASD